MLVHQVDLARQPVIYRTDNQNYYKRLCIDFFPETLPTIASFSTLVEVRDFLIENFGERQYREWFPEGIIEEVGGKVVHV